MNSPSPDRYQSARLETPLGPMAARAGSDGWRFLEFEGGEAEDGSEGGAARQGGGSVRLVSTDAGAGTLESGLFATLSDELGEYFAGTRKTFDIPLAPSGTPFQERVWEQLLSIPYGETRTYAEQAAALGDPKAVRASASANGRNPVAILVPCHRVVGSDGSLTGYAGGLWRKRFLLELERGAAEPGLPGL